MYLRKGKTRKSRNRGRTSKSKSKKIRKTFIKTQKKAHAKISTNIKNPVAHDARSFKTRKEILAA